MSAKTRFLRFVMGVLLVIIILAVSFSVLPTWIHTWGATQEELERTYPGDEILPQPQIQWTHGLTVAAPAQTVWQWIIQIGDTRAGYYSYTFIENLISGEDLYHNADRIMPEYQNPQPGDGIIADIMVIREYEPNRWMLAEAKMGIGWTWLWYVDPIDDSQSRLVVRMNIKLPDEYSNPITNFFIDVGGFIMERNMMFGIKERAEGKGEPPNIETIEIMLWLAALAIGFVAAWMFVTQKKWKLPLLTGILSVLVLLLLTFIQPQIWLRLLLDLLLLAGLLFAIREKRKFD